MPEQVERQLPSSIDAEESVIASLLVSPDEIYAVSDLLKPEHFFREKNAWAYAAILKVWIDHQPIDQITVSAELARNGRLEATGISYLSGLVSILGNSLECEYHAQMIRKAWQQRQVISAGHQIAALGYEPDVSSTLEKAQELLRRISPDGRKEGPVTLAEIMGEYMPKLTDYLDAPEATRGLPTGFRGIDSVTSGISGLTILGGRPSQCKTELALSIVRHIVADRKKSVLIFSADASRWIVAERLLSIEAGSTIQRVKAADGASRQILEEHLRDASDILIAEFGQRIGVDDSPRLSRARIEGRLQRWESEHGKPSLLIFDYVELYAQKGEGEERVSRVIEDFRDIGRIHDIPVLALSQLNREIEKRDVPRPQLSDLRYCVTPDTLIECEGGRHRIASLYKSKAKIRVKTFWMDGFKFATPNIIKTGLKDCLRVTTKNGNVLELSKDTPVFNGAVWLSAKHLKIGDKIVVDKSVSS